MRKQIQLPPATVSPPASQSPILPAFWPLCKPPVLQRLLVTHEVSLSHPAASQNSSVLLGAASAAQEYVMGFSENVHKSFVCVCTHTHMFFPQQLSVPLWQRDLDGLHSTDFEACTQTLHTVALNSFCPGQAEGGSRANDYRQETRRQEQWQVTCCG